MSKQGFTPGPWEAEGQYGGLIRAANGVNVASTLNQINATKKQWPVPEDPAEVAANARLIASAPSLYAALGKCVTALMFEAEQAQQRQDAVAGAQILDALTAARAALEKVRA